MQIRSDLVCDLVDSWGSDARTVHAARVSTKGVDATDEESVGLTRFLMANRHASPFEHSGASFIIEAPIFVAREWHRHRTQSYNETSGRYRVLPTEFYMPPLHRPIIQTGKPGAYTLEPGGLQLVQDFRAECEHAFDTAATAYKILIDEGVAREVARNVLPVATYTSWMATANLRNWLNFLSLRTTDQAQWEIRQLANQVEYELIKLFPITLDAWRETRGSL